MHCKLVVQVIICLFATVTAKYLSGLQVSVATCHLFTTPGGEFTLCFLLLINVKHGSCNTIFDLTRLGIKPESNLLKQDALFIQRLIVYSQLQFFL